MDRRRVRSEADWQTMASELQALKRKLHSKSEALLIISKDLDGTRKERDQFKLMAEKLRVRCQAYKRQFSEFPLTKDQASLIQMLRDTKNQKIAHQKQSEVLQLKLNEALGDVKLLRERFARQRIGDDGVGPRHFPAHEREKLVTQLEDAKQQAENYRQELVIATDQAAELMAEKCELTRKAERLNSELNFMLNGDKKRIIDIDALCMENKYLQERVKQCQEEKNTLHSQVSKFKAILNSRKASNADLKPGKIRGMGLVISPRQVQKILMDKSGLPTSAETVSDLQSIAAALLETINDKNLAMHHLRNTNKILGKRVAELELKLKTLEVAGLWTMAGHGQRLVPSSTPKTVSEGDASEEEFFSSLGSRLGKLTDVCDRNFKQQKLISLTPESSGSTSDVKGFAEDAMTDESNSDVVETRSDAAMTHSDVSETHSDAAEMHSDAAMIHSDATGVHSDVSETHSDVAEIHSDAAKTRFDAVGTHSDVSETRSDAAKTRFDATGTHSDVSETHSDAAEMHSDATKTQSDATETRSDATETRSDAAKTHSDATDTLSDATETRLRAISNNCNATETVDAMFNEACVDPTEDQYDTSGKKWDVTEVDDVTGHVTYSDTSESSSRKSATMADADTRYEAPSNGTRFDVSGDDLTEFDDATENETQHVNTTPLGAGTDPAICLDTTASETNHDAHCRTDEDGCPIAAGHQVDVAFLNHSAEDDCIDSSNMVEDIADLRQDGESSVGDWTNAA